MRSFHCSSSVVLLLIISLLTTTCGLRRFFGISDVSSVLPQKNDFVLYLESLQLITEFCMKNKNELDVNYAFGIFLSNVNLKSVLEKKQNNVPNLLRMYMKSLLTINDDLLDYFKDMEGKNQDEEENKSKMITTLFSNETQWIKAMPMFDTELMAENVRHFKKPSSWAKYLGHVGSSVCDFGKVSDKCMVSLASNKVHESKYSRCSVDSSCYDMLINGTNYGNSLSHRLLFLLNARYARGCNIFSYEEDREMIKTMCAISYEEAEYIAKHDFGIVDLIMEHITLCSLDGHAQFLQREWITSILHFQTPYGCFIQDPDTLKDLTSSRLPRTPSIWEIVKGRGQSMMGGLCNAHVTAVAVATLSAAIRYILEVYY